MVPDDDLADAGDAIEKLATRPHNEHMVLRHGRWVCARRFHKVGDAGVSGREVHFDVIMVHDELDDTLCGVVVRRDDFFDLSDDARVGLGRPVPSVLSAAKELGAAFLVCVIHVELGDFVLSLQQTNQGAKYREDHGIYLVDAGLDHGGEGLDSSLRDRGIIIAEFAIDVPDFSVRFVVADGLVERVRAVPENVEGFPIAPAARLLCHLDHFILAPHGRVALAVLCDVSGLNTGGVEGFACLCEKPRDRGVEKLRDGPLDGREEILSPLHGPLRHFGELHLLRYYVELLVCTGKASLGLDIVHEVFRDVCGDDNGFLAALSEVGGVRGWKGRG